MKRVRLDAGPLHVRSVLLSEWKEFDLPAETAELNYFGHDLFPEQIFWKPGSNSDETFVLCFLAWNFGSLSEELSFCCCLRVMDGKVSARFNLIRLRLFRSLYCVVNAHEVFSILSSL